MDEFFKLIPSLGVGGVLAGMMFWFYRVDSQRNIDQWKDQSAILSKLIQDNTASNITLAVLINSLHDHMISSKSLDDRRDVVK